MHTSGFTCCQCALLSYLLLIYLEVMEDTDSLRREYEGSNAWGLLSSIDLHGCNPETIRDAEKIKQFVIELCDRIGMKRYGECQVVHFGEDPRVAGFSMTQLIETSLISAHFANETNAVYLDIFSCKFYSPHDAAEFAKEFFAAEDYRLAHTLRV